MQPCARVFVSARAQASSFPWYSLRDKVLQLTEDHRVVNPMERNRLSDAGFKLGEGDTRLCGEELIRRLSSARFGDCKEGLVVVGRIPSADIAFTQEVSSVNAFWSRQK